MIFTMARVKKGPQTFDTGKTGKKLELKLFLKYAIMKNNRERRTFLQKKPGK